MVWNTVYLSTPNPVGNYQGSAGSTVHSDVSVAGGIDAATLDLTSTLSVDGVSTFNAAINSASGISGGAIAGTTGNFGSTLSVRGIQTNHAALNSASALSVGAITATTIDSRSALSVGAITATTIDSRSALSVGAVTATTGDFSSDVSTVGDFLGAGATLTSTLSTTDSDFLSVQSAANASGMTTGQLRLVFAASGVSLMYSSGETSYTVGVSTVSVAQA